MTFSVLYEVVDMAYTLTPEFKKRWSLRDDVESAHFLCRVVYVGGQVIDRIPVCLFNFDSEARLFKEYLTDLRAAKAP